MYLRGCTEEIQTIYESTRLVKQYVRIQYNITSTYKDMMTQLNL